MRMPFPLSAMAMTLALAAGCGNPDEDGPAEIADTVAVTDTVPAAADTSAPVAVELPADFPADFPVAPASSVVSASTAPDAGGSYSEVSLVAEAEPADSYGWYRQALTDAGWQISSEGQTDETRTLHATQGESYVDLTVMPHPDRGAGWVVVDASIWKAGT